MSQYNTQQLTEFIKSATAATYAGGGSYEQNPERPGFYELVYSDHDWSYRDSYTGYYRSSGTEVVRFQNQIVWTSCYGGGMVSGQEKLAADTFTFLKKAMLAKPTLWVSFRGPVKYEDDKWAYSYKQEGRVDNFVGYEKISLSGQVVFSHHIIGGLIIDKN